MENLELKVDNSSEIKSEKLNELIRTIATSKLNSNITRIELMLWALTQTQKNHNLKYPQSEQTIISEEKPFFIALASVDLIKYPQKSNGDRVFYRDISVTDDGKEFISDYSPAEDLKKLGIGQLIFYNIIV
jgi:hypothetical protein